MIFHYNHMKSSTFSKFEVEGRTSHRNTSEICLSCLNWIGSVLLLHVFRSKTVSTKCFIFLQFLHYLENKVDDFLGTYKFKHLRYSKKIIVFSLFLSVKFFSLFFNNGFFILLLSLKYMFCLTRSYLCHILFLRNATTSAIKMRLEKLF